MENDAFIYPVCFKIVLNLYSCLFASPFITAESEESGCLVRSLRRIHKLVCFTLHSAGIIYMTVYSTSTCLINLRKEPTKIFFILHVFINWTALVAMMHLFYAKQSTVQNLIGRSAVKFSKKPRIIFAVVIGVLIFPIGQNLVGIIDTTNLLMKVSERTLDMALHPILEAVYAKPQVSKAELKNANMRLDYRERIIAIFLLALYRHAGIVSSLLIWFTFLGAFALYEVNSAMMLEISSGKNVNIKIVQDNYNQIQEVIKPLNTVCAMAFYANIATEITRGGEYKLLAWITQMIAANSVVLVFIMDSAATSKGRQLAKAVLHSEERIQRCLLNEPNHSWSERRGYTPSEIKSIVDLSYTGSGGNIGTITYGSMGMSFAISVQFAIILLQFVELQYKGKEILW